MCFRDGFFSNVSENISNKTAYKSKSRAHPCARIATWFGLTGATETPDKLPAAVAARFTLGPPFGLIQFAGI